MANKKISELPYINGGKISGNTLVPLVTYFSAATGDTVHTYIDDFQTYLISGLTGNTDVFVTGGTYSAGTITFTNNTGGTFNVTGVTFSGGSSVSGDYLPLSGGTVTGSTQFTVGLTASTISATTYQNLPDNVTGNYLPLSGGTVSGNTIFTSGLTGVTLDISGKTTTTNLQVTSGASVGYVLTAIDSSGNTQWIDLGTNGNELDPVLTITGVTASTINIGDRFLISGGTGIWSGRDNQIAEYTGAGPTDYSYYIPILDDVVFVTDTLSTLRFNGTSWIAWRGTAILQNGNSLTTSVNIGTNNARNLTFRTSGQTRMLISGNTGNVYIGTGTTLPIDQKLLVDGNIKIADSRYYGYSGGTGTTITGRTLNIRHTAVNTHSIVGGPNDESITFGPSNRIFIQAGEVPIIGALYISPPSGAALLGANNTSGFQIINGFAVQANTTRNGIIFQQNISWNGGTGATSTSTINTVKISPTANMVTGTTNGNLFVLDPTINYTGGTLNLRGLYYNPTVSATTSAFTETAIETVRGNVLLNTLSGNTGIGTTTPSEKLDVSGKTKTTNLQVTSGATAGYVLTSDASGNASWQASTGGGTFTGGTVSGSTIFTNGLTANTISATTLTVNGVNITGDTYVTGLTFNTSNYNLTIGRNDGVSFTDSLSILASDLTVTGGTYNPNNGTATFTNNTGGTFNVTGFLTGLTDTFVTGGTYSNGTATFTNTSGGTFNVSGFTQPFSGGSGNCITDLYITNLYGCSPITVHDTIETVTGKIRTSGGTGAELNLKDVFGPNGTWSITSDNANYGAGSSWVYGEPNNGTQIAYQIDSYPGEAIGIGIYDNFSDLLFTGKEIVISNNKNNSSSTGISDRRSVFIGSKNSTSLSGITNSVVIGGNGITASTNDTVYVDNLNIKTIGSGTSIINLGLDINGNVVTGTTGGGTFTGGTVSGSTIFTNGLSANTISATTYQNLPDNVTGRYLPLSGGTVTGNTIFTSGLTANTLNVTGNTNVKAFTGTTGYISGSGQNILTVIGSGNSTTSPLFSVQGSSGELFSVTDSLVGSLFSVNDISGLPILETFSDNTTLWGSYQAPSLNTTTRTSLTAGTNTIYSIPTSAYTGAFYEYTLISSGATGARAGQIMSIWSGTTANFTETSTTDIGTTTGVTFTVAVSGNNAVLSSSATTAGWTVKTIIRSI